VVSQESSKRKLGRAKEEEEEEYDNTRL